MDVKIFLIFIFEIYGVVGLSENCTCYVGHAMDTGEVDLNLESCILSPTVPSTADSVNTTISTPTPTNETATPTTVGTTVSSMITDTQNITFSNVTVEVNSTDAPQEEADDEVTTKPTAKAPDAASDSGKGSKRKRRDAEVKPTSCCQISITQDQGVKLDINATRSRWTANFSCSQNPSENAKVCNETGCNDLQFLKRFVKNFNVPIHCREGKRADQTTEIIGFLFESGKMLESCNNFSTDKCSGLNLTNTNCPQEGFCCCPLSKEICTAIPTTSVGSTISAGSTILPRGTKQPRSNSNSKKTSFDWKIVGYIATGVVCGVFLTIVVKFIYGKGKKNRIRIPNYKYSRLRADYVADQEL